MSAATNAEAAATLDARFPTSGATDHVAYSVNGTSEWSGLGRTPVGAANWAAATVADPSVKANAGPVTSAAATAAGTVSHFGIFTASSGGTQRISWTPLAAAKALSAGDTMTFAAGALQITLT